MGRVSSPKTATTSLARDRGKYTGPSGAKPSPPRAVRHLASRTPKQRSTADTGPDSRIASGATLGSTVSPHRRAYSITASAAPGAGWPGLTDSSASSPPSGRIRRYTATVIGSAGSGRPTGSSPGRRSGAPSLRATRSEPVSTRNHHPSGPTDRLSGPLALLGREYTHTVVSRISLLVSRSRVLLGAQWTRVRTALSPVNRRTSSSSCIDGAMPSSSASRSSNRSYASRASLMLPSAA